MAAGVRVLMFALAIIKRSLDADCSGRALAPWLARRDCTTGCINVGKPVHSIESRLNESKRSCITTISLSLPCSLTVFSSGITDKIRVNLHHGKTEDAVVRAVIDHTDGTKLQVDFGHEQTALLAVKQVVSD
jgi:hypothetical protein